MDSSSSAAAALVQALPCVIAPDTTVFVRSGAAHCVLGPRTAFLDANYALIVPKGARPVVLTAYESPASLVLFTEAGTDGGACARALLVDSRQYLEHFCGSAFRATAAEAPGHDICSIQCARYVRAMQEFIAGSFEQRVSLRDVAQVCALSPFTASRIFHRHVGIPLRAYLKRLRLRTALHRILSTRGDLASVALDLGFCDHAHFSKAFRGEFGITPSEFRCRMHAFKAS